MTEKMLKKTPLIRIKFMRPSSIEGKPRGRLNQVGASWVIGVSGMYWHCLAAVCQLLIV